MKLDEQLIDQKLSLDVTPLIDVVFLLVLFFAVSTSFISTDDLQTLRSTLVGLSVDKQQLSGRLSYQDEELGRLGGAFTDLQTEYDHMVETKTRDLKRLAGEVEQAAGETAKIRWMLDALEREKVSLIEAVEQGKGERDGLREQLESAFRDYQALEVRLNTVNLARDDQSRTEALLLALYEERVSEADTLEDKLHAATTREATLADVVASRTEESRELTVELEVLRRRVARLQKNLEKYRAIADEDALAARRLAATKVSIGKALAEYLRDNRIGLEQSQQKLVLQLSDRVLFDSGSAELRVDGVELLRSVGNTLKARLGDLSVQIGGHTDNVPLRGRPPGGPRGNWALSAARAVNVVRFLEQEIGLDPGQLSATGYGEFRPVGDNSTAEGRALNRRIELVLAPR